MARDIWVISDTHLFHSNILNFVDHNTGKHTRPGFDNVNHMNNYILEKWNSVVKQGDIVYHLGDVTFGSQDDFKTIWPKFNGSKRLIIGNHDDVKFLSSGGFFKKVLMWRMFPEYGLIMSHVPLHLSSMHRGNREVPLCGVHGHTHQHGSPEGPYISVCVELRDYTPVHIEDLAKEAKESI